MFYLRLFVLAKKRGTPQIFFLMVLFFQFISRTYLLLLYLIDYKFLDLWVVANVCENPVDVELKDAYRWWWWCNCCNIFTWSEQFSGAKGNSFLYPIRTFWFYFLCSLPIKHIVFRDPLWYNQTQIWEFMDKVHWT